MSTSDAAVGSPPSGSPADSSLFARNATGLVRGVSPRSAFVINFIPGHPVQSLAASFFVVFSLFPGGSYLLGLLLVIPLSLAFSYAFGLLTQMIPRSGGDYMLVSRVIHPAVGLVSSFCMTLAGLLSNAFFGYAFVTIGLGPGLVGLGLLAGDHSLVNAGTTISTEKGWRFALGALMMCLSAVILSGGWRWTLRIQNTIFWVVTGSLIVCVIVAIFTSHSAFVNNFNSFAHPFTHSNNSYQDVINASVKAGTDVHPAFSFSKTIPIIGFFATFSIYSYWSTFVGGELRQGSTMKTANTMAGAGVTCILIVVVCASIFLHTFGHPFMIASGSSTGLGTAIPTSATWFFLTGASVGSPVFLAVVTLAYVLYWPLICYISMIQPTRMIFAYAFDGILPKGVTKLSRTRSPYVAVIIALVMSLLVFLWAINSSSFLQVLVYATLVQLIAMGLVGLSAVLVPWRRPEFYRASTARQNFLGIPVVAIAGAVAVAAAVFIWIIYFSNKAAFGLANTGRMFLIFGVTIGLAIVYYFVARAVRSGQGVSLDRAYAEIPPE